jgi:hypothetical protein
MSDHWLTGPASIKRLWILFIGILAATVLAESWVIGHPHFDIERLFAFNALFGFMACAAMIVVARVLALVLKRPDTYYEAPPDE